MSSLDSTGYSSWWLERDEENLYLICNGKRGRSRRSDQEFGNIVSVSQRDDKFKFTFVDGRKTVVSTQAVSVQAMSQNFGSEESLDEVIDYIAKTLNEKTGNCTLILYKTNGQRAVLSAYYAPFPLST